MGFRVLGLGVYIYAGMSSQAYPEESNKQNNYQADESQKRHIAPF